MRAMLLLLGLVTLMFVDASSASACDAVGPNAHIGVISVIDLRGSMLALKDAETGKPIVFAVTPEQLRSVRVADEISVTYVADGKQLRATSIKRN